ncbi:GlcG/HbpS family heme-binding protein [Clostridium tarantellae]|uniref:Heme-binding protein n=1 Tax=Clostridium tarantellae TaxID=39493 RepID=A0A6I1MKU5_9CLOT|nr:heme-binding protein [Clostridium tarantellae]MPQ43353.1 heme-binding protein [Clostridium tarantellae]
MLKEFKQLTLNAAKTIVEAAEKKAIEIKVPVVISVVDAGGNLVLMNRMDDAFVTSIDIANNKAFTAWALKQGTHELSEVVQPGNSLYGLGLTNQCRIITFGGGLPIIIDGQVVGAVGVSGGTVEEDLAIATAGRDIIK